MTWRDASIIDEVLEGITNGDITANNIAQHLWGFKGVQRYGDVRWKFFANNNFTDFPFHNATDTIGERNTEKVFETVTLVDAKDFKRPE